MTLSILRSSSQTGSTRVNKDTVRLPIATAQKVAKDLVLLKAVKEENQLLKIDTLNMSKQLEIKDTVISNRNIVINLKDSIITDRTKQLGLKDIQIASRDKKIKWQNFKLSVAGISILGLGIFAILK